MKRIFIVIILLAFGISLHAQHNQHSNYLGFSVGGGINTPTYKTADGDYSLGFGFSSGLNYTHFFGKHFGIGFGAWYGHYNASVLYDFTETTTGLTHDDNTNLTYDLETSYKGWRERQTLSYLSIPVELYWRAPLNDKWAFLFGLGAAVDLPLSGKYRANEGSYENAGQFYVNGTPLSYTVQDLPNHGFRTYDADFEEEVSLKKIGVSLIADLGFNYQLCNNWGLYFGLYGGYSLTNMLDSASNKPILAINEDDASQLDYNGTLASNQIDALRLLNAGVKIGINLGWSGRSSSKKTDNEPSVLEEAYSEPTQEQTADERKADQVEPINQASEDTTNPIEDAQKAEPSEIVEPTDEEQPADKNEDTNEQPADNYGNNNYGNGNYGNNAAEEDPEEAAAREARCNARRMNNPDMAEAMKNIDADLDEAEQAANEANSDAAKEAVADARAKAADAKNAYNNGQYCKAYDLFNGAYGDIADSYAYDAAAYAGDNADATKAADDAALYADAAHKDGLDCAMAASRNARLNSEIAHNPSGTGKSNTAYNDPNYADYLANEALAMADDANSKAARTDAKDASGKAYRGKLADSYAACASSFAKSANAYAAKSDNTEAKAAADEAQRYANEAAEAARMGDTAAAYRAARAAQQAAERARRLSGNADDSAAAEPASDNSSNNAPADKAKLQQYLDQINATVHFDFGSSEPKFDNKTDLAIRALCAAMKADSRVKILITGHTDNVGTAQGNMNYGKKRAEALKQLMVKQGAPAGSISTASKGQNEPVVDNDTEEHRYQNRRAVVTLR